MANENRMYIEQREGGDYAVRRGNSERASAVTETQAEAIGRAKEIDPNATIMVERVRNIGNGRDKWRTP
jgi:hypothetical protein